MIDCHFHLDESMISLPGLIAGMDAAGVERVALIPRLCPPLSLSFPFVQLSGFFRRLVNRESGLVQRGAAAFYKSMVKADGTVDVGGRRYPVIPQPPNEEVRKAVFLHPERLWGWTFVNPAGPDDPIAEIEKGLKTPGIIGVKAHSYWHNYPVAKLTDAAALASEKNLPLLLHLGADENGDFKILPERFPKLKIIYAHAGVPYAAAVCAYVREKKNVYVDLSCTVYVDQKAAALAVNRAGAGKCLFGTDGPYFHINGDRFDYGPSEKIIRGLGLSREDLERIEKKNFLEIIGRS
ncbi:MAG: amidohydrolase family protein [bacterium]|nr:amidohydrolase family protein [bacterium]